MSSNPSTTASMNVSVASSPTAASASAAAASVAALNSAMSSTSSSSTSAGRPSSRRLILGVCAMDKKTRSKPMTQILDRLRAYGEFEIIIFGDRLILDESRPVGEWPICHCLISFTSKGFPLARVIEYVRLRRPFCVNDLPSQVVLQNRYDIYKILEKNGIPTPKHLYVDRSATLGGMSGGGGNKEAASSTSTTPASTSSTTTTSSSSVTFVEPVIEEYDDYIIIDGVRMDKPLVEKPFDGDDHNINIYYGKSAGGGSRRLFRKIGNRSSRFYPKVNTLRRNGSFVYESLLGWQSGTQQSRASDLKVYTIGPGYAHGELRKSPVVDGVVARDPDQKELRLLSKLTLEEREIARSICVAFKQNICGFDIIRTGGKSYVIDVNGWSFVKGNISYYTKCARIMRKMCLNCTKGREALRLERPLELIPVPPTPAAATTPHNNNSNDTTSVLPLSRASSKDIREAKEKEAKEAKDAKEKGRAGESRNSTPPTAAMPAPATAVIVPRLTLPETKLGEVVASSSDSSTSTSTTASVIPAGSALNVGIIEVSTPSSAANSILSVGQFTSLDAPLQPASSLSTATNPRGLYSTHHTNTIQDSDNNDILLGLVAMFRHADRTPKQKVKLNTKSRTLLSFFEEQRKEKEKEKTSKEKGDKEKGEKGEKDSGGSGTEKSSKNDSGSSSDKNSSSSSNENKKKTSTKKRKKSTDSSSDKDSRSSTPSLTASGSSSNLNNTGGSSAKEGNRETTAKDAAASSAAVGTTATTGTGSMTEPKSSPTPSPTSSPLGTVIAASAATTTTAAPSFQYKDLKWKKKADLNRIRDGIKILLVKEQLREKRKRKAQALVNEGGTPQQANYTNEWSDDEIELSERDLERIKGGASTSNKESANKDASSATAGSAAASSNPDGTAATTDNVDVSSTTTRALSTSVSSKLGGGITNDEDDIDPLSTSIPSLDDNLLEAAISAEQVRSRTKDALKDPEYMSKLYQISSVLNGGFGGVKVQLKPKKFDDVTGRVIQALLIVKWGGEMTHAGVGQSRQYAAAFWDDMIPPPYLPTQTTQSGGTSTALPHVMNIQTVKGVISPTSVSHPGTTQVLASMANTNADASAAATGGDATPGTATTNSAAAAAAAGGAAPRLEIGTTTLVSQNSASGSEADLSSQPASPTVDPTSPDALGGSITNIAADDDDASSLSNSLSSPHEFAYDHNSSLTQSDRAKLKSQLQAARSSGVRASNIGVQQTIPENVTMLPIGSGVPQTPKRKSSPSLEENVGVSTSSSSSSNNTSSSLGPVTLLSTKKSSKSTSNLLSLTTQQIGSSGSGASSGKDVSSKDQSGSGLSINASGSTLLSPTNPDVCPTSLLPASLTSSLSTEASERLISFRRQRLAFFQGLNIYASDEARVVASAESFYTSTFEHAHGLNEVTLEQLRDREEKKKAQQIKEWIDNTRKTHLTHDKAVQEYLDDTSMCAEQMARSKEGVKFILMAESSLTPAQVTRHMLAQEQIARATSEAERRDIMAEEEELLRIARAEAEGREREEQSQQVSLRQQQLAEEVMEEYMDRLAELEEDGMNLEEKVGAMKEHIKRVGANAASASTSTTATDGSTTSSPTSSTDQFDFCIACQTTSPEVITELEALLRKIYAELSKTSTKKEKKKAKQAAKEAQAAAAAGVTVVTSAAATAAETLAAASPDGSPLSASSLGSPAAAVSSNTAAAAPAKPRISPPTPPAITPPPSPSSFGPTAMTEWGVRCLRWTGKPRPTLENLYQLLLQLQVQIHSKCEWAEKHSVAAAQAAAAASPGGVAALANVEQSSSASTSISEAPSPRDATTTGLSEGNTDSTPSSSAPSIQQQRKLSSSGGESGINTTAPNSLSSSRMTSGNSQSNLLKDQTKPKAATEFEYVYDWDDIEDEINGRPKKKQSHQMKFGLGHLVCHRETLFLMRSRWDNLIASFYDPKTNIFDPTKIPDVYDSIKYDVLHNLDFISDVRPLYSAIKRIAEFVVPNEYGILRKDKWYIGCSIARPLLRRMIRQLEGALSPKCPSRVTLYFSSESHIHALRNVLLLSGIACNRTVATSLDAIELSYLSHAVFRLYEDVSRSLDDPLRYYVNIQFSPGASLDPYVYSEEEHTLPVSRPVPVNGRIPFHLFAQIFSLTGEKSDTTPPRGYVQPWIPSVHEMSSTTNQQAPIAQTLQQVPTPHASAQPSPRK